MKIRHQTVLKKLLRPFDYAFYRLAELFFKKDGSEAIRAIGLLSLMQGLYIGFFVTMLNRKIAEFELITSLKWGKILLAALTITLFAVNYKRYANNFYTMAGMWRGTEKIYQRRVRSIYIILSFLSSLLIYLFALL
ncbi:hypothetical protein [Hymenobacter oligotrophus]|uniref:hypothetical protein n=1 Tax=Hymenobacter oligotrophus TaxID=2319843 RepID=UPI0013C349E5|nr:hypothetical protein [Hymenobacter oligotrophus]